MEIITIRRYFSPAGEIVLGSSGNELCLCDWATEPRRRVIDRRICRCLGARLEPGDSAVIEAAAGQLDEYFAGQRHDFTLPLRFAGTDFRHRVWAELMKIPYGATITYADVAAAVGSPRGVRAVASAIGANTISVIVPCHRVIGRDGRLTGYAGGLEAKRLLLDLEARFSAPSAALIS